MLCCRFDGKMASVSQMRQDSLQKSILFMQQEHANTLKGLHEEIQKLQKKCSGKLIAKLQIFSYECTVPNGAISRKSIWMNS